MLLLGGSLAALIFLLLLRGAREYARQIARKADNSLPIGSLAYNARDDMLLRI